MSSVRTKRQKKDATTPVEPPHMPMIATPYNMEKEAAQSEGGGKGSGGGRALSVILVAGWQLHFWKGNVSMKL